MDGRGRRMDNVFIERLWRSMKHECVYLHTFETGSEARAGIGRWIDYYDMDRPHSALGDRAPEEACQGTPDPIRLAGILLISTGLYVFAQIGGSK
ncbi:Mobile element protein [Azospirillum argentinense]